MKLKEEIERISGGGLYTYVYREEEKVFFDQDISDYITIKEWGWFEVSDEKEEYEDEDIDPQF